jgi:transposase-like protein
MLFIILSLLLLSSLIEAISKGGDDILIQLQEDIVSTRKSCTSSNSVMALLIDDLLKNATHVIDNAKFYNKTSSTDFPMNLDTFHIESAKTLETISSNFSSPVKNVKDSIERSKDSVDSLKRTVSETLLSFKTEAENIFTRRQRDEIDIIRNAVDRIKMKQDMSRQEVLEEIKLKNSKSRELFPDALYSEDGWQEAGYRVDDIEKIQEQCKSLMQSISLHRFELRPDTRRTDGQSINTTIQIGVSDWTVAKTILDESFLHDIDPIVDAITLFHCNLIVLSTLADRINLIDAQIQATESSLDGLSIIHEDLLQNYRELNRSGVETMATLALNIGVLETETNMKRIKVEVKNITNAIDIALEKEKMEKQTYVAEAEAQSLNKLTVNENVLERNRMIENKFLDSVIDSTIEIISTVNELMEMNRAMIR